MNRYPWPQMQIGETQEVAVTVSLTAVKSACGMWVRSKRNLNEDGSRKKFDIRFKCQVGKEGTEQRYNVLQVERIA